MPATSVYGQVGNGEEVTNHGFTGTNNESI